MNNRILLALKNRSFFFLWIAEIFAQLAMNMLNFMLLLVAYSLTKSSTAVSGIVLAFTVPAIVFGVFAGVYVDRWNKKIVLFATNAARVILVLLLAFFHKNLIVLYGITFFIAIITQFFIPAETPMIPVLVGKDLLLSANSLFGVALYGSILIAYALSGPWLLVLGTMHGLIAIAGLFVIAALAVLCISYAPSVKKNSYKKIVSLSFFQEIKHTIRFILQVKKLFHALSLLALSQILIFIIAVIGPGYAQQVLNIRIDAFPLLFVTPAVIGMAIGTVILNRFFHRNKHETATLGLFLMGITLFLLPYGSKVTSRYVVQSMNVHLPHILQITNLHIMVLLAVIMGLANALVFVPSNTIVQEETSDEIRGKVYGALNTITAVLAILPVVLVGSIADIFGVTTVLISLAIAVLLLGVIRLFV